MTKYSLMPAKLCSHKGFAALGAALALNGIILLGGITALTSNLLEQKQVASSGRAGYAKQANINAALITKELIDARIWTRDSSTGVWSTALSNTAEWISNTASTPKGSIIIYSCEPGQISTSGVPDDLSTCAKIATLSKFGDVSGSNVKVDVSTSYPAPPDPTSVTQVLQVAMPFLVSTPPPTLVSVSPVPASTVASTAITIIGTGFKIGGGVTVMIGAQPCASVNVTVATSLTCTAPAQAAGNYAILVTNPDTQNSSATPLMLNYQNAGPTVTSISPVSGPPAGGTAVTITGTGFRTGATVLIGTSACNSVSIVGSSPSTSMTCTTTAGTASATAVAVKVTNLDAKFGSKVSAYTYTAVVPVFTSMTDAQGTVTGGHANGGNSFFINGSGFTSSSTVMIGALAAASVTYVSATKLTVKAPSWQNQNVSVSVTVTTGSLTSNNKPYFLGGFTAKPASTTTCYCWKCATTITGSGYSWSSDGESMGTVAEAVTGGCPTNGGSELNSPWARNVCAKSISFNQNGPGTNCHN